MLVIVICGTQALSYLISEHLVYFARMTSSKATNALTALVFNKSLKVSSLTNKQFNVGQIVNFIQVDAVKMQFLTSQAPMIFRLGLVIIVSISALFWYLGWSFLSGIVMFNVTIAANFVLSRIQVRLQKDFMRR